jgi:tetratricopeptide (TPR) repeat protein
MILCIFLQIALYCFSNLIIRMKCILIILILFTTSSIICQESVSSLLNQGVKYHDEGNYVKAIEYYEQALKLDSTKSTILYELAMSNYSLENYDKVVQYANKVILKKDNNLVQAYAIKGSALDAMGKLAESTALLEEAIVITKGHQTLYYNLAINYIKSHKLNLAEENFIKAIDLDANHSNSHYMLAVLNNDIHNPVQSILSGVYFLLLEPNSKRSIEIFEIVKKSLDSNISVNKEKPDNINVFFNAEKDTLFSSAELFISLLSASGIKDSISEPEQFSNRMKSLFTFLGELKKEKKDIWTAFYLPFYYELSKSSHYETFIKYISQKQYKESHDWLIRHERELTGMGDWLSKN